MLFILSETFTNGFNALTLDIFSIFSIACAITIIISKNPIYSVLFLIGLFFMVSIYLVLFGLTFIGLAYLLVYVGAISILFLFILMLINIRISELLTDNRNSIVLAVLVVLGFNFPVHDTLPLNVKLLDLGSKYVNNSTEILENFNLGSFFSLLTNNIASVFSNSWDNNLVAMTQITSIGNILYTGLFIFILVTSLILLVAMVGAIVITVTKSTLLTDNKTNQSSVSSDYGFIKYTLTNEFFGFSWLLGKITLTVSPKIVNIVSMLPKAGPIVVLPVIVFMALNDPNSTSGLTQENLWSLSNIVRLGFTNLESLRVSIDNNFQDTNLEVIRDQLQSIRHMIASWPDIVAAFGTNATNAIFIDGIDRIVSDIQTLLNQGSGDEILRLTPDQINSFHNRIMDYLNKLDDLIYIISDKL